MRERLSVSVCVRVCVDVRVRVRVLVLVSVRVRERTGGLETGGIRWFWFGCECGCGCGKGGEDGRRERDGVDGGGERAANIGKEGRMAEGRGTATGKVAVRVERRGGEVGGVKLERREVVGQCLLNPSFHSGT